MPKPKEIIVSASSHIPYWTAFLNNNRLKNQTEVPETLTIDLCSVNFIAPYHVVSLACLIEEYYLQDVPIKFKTCKSRGIEYLDRLGFFSYWRKGFDRGRYRSTAVGTSICLWKLNAEMIHPYVVYSQKFYQNNFFKEKDLQPLNTSLAEIFNNIIDHSKSVPGGYVFSQYYPNKEELIISVCDFGNGIPNTVNKFLEETTGKSMRNDTALHLAFKKGFSTKSTPANKGFGLDNILSIVKSLKSTMLMVSNNATVLQPKNGVLVKDIMPQDFPGTQIVISLNTKRLNEREVEEIKEEEFYL